MHAMLQFKQLRVFSSHAYRMNKSFLKPSAEKVPAAIRMDVVKVMDGMLQQVLSKLRLDLYIRILISTRFLCIA
jgi:hypothetical protein